MRTRYLLIYFLFCLTTYGCQNQQTKTETTIQGDSLSNIYREYYPNGKLKIEVEIINGFQNGTLKEFYENGQLKLSQDWKMGEPDGDYKLFLPNGDLLFHRRFEIKKDAKEEYRVMREIYNDTTKIFKKTNRIVINDLKEFIKAVKVVPTRTVNFGVENRIGFLIPNIKYPSVSVVNATLYPAQGSNGVYYMIKAKDKNKNVIVNLTAEVNDTVINFEPIELTVME